MTDVKVMANAFLEFQRQGDPRCDQVVARLQRVFRDMRLERIDLNIRLLAMGVGTDGQEQ